MNKQIIRAMIELGATQDSNVWVTAKEVAQQIIDTAKTKFSVSAQTERDWTVSVGRNLKDEMRFKRYMGCTMDNGVLKFRIVGTVPKQLLA